MGRDKSRLRWRNRTLVGHLRHHLAAAGPTVRVRIIRRDCIPHCGPLSGIYTALRRTDADAELILACDMPFVPLSLLQRLVNRLRPGVDAAFVHHDGLAGFPCLLRPRTREEITRLIDAGQLSVQALARSLKARRVRPTAAEVEMLLNVNTPEDWARAKAALARAALKK